MAARRDRTGKWRSAIAAELNLLPLMNVFIVLIPLLLLSAVFVEVTVIRMDGSGGDVAAAEAGEPVDLTVRFEPEAYVILARGEALRSVPRPGDAAGAPDQAVLAALGAALVEVTAALPPDGAVKLVAAETTRYEEIVAVMDLARALGLPHAALAGAATEGR